MVRAKENPAKIAAWLHNQHPKIRPLALSLSRLIPSMMMAGAFITSFFDYEISNYIGIAGSFIMILISIVSACLRVRKTQDENTALVKTFHFVKRKIDKKTKMGITFSNKDISDLLGTFCEMTLQREIPVEVPLETSILPSSCVSCEGRGCSLCEQESKAIDMCCQNIRFGIFLRVLKAIRTVVNDFVPGWLFMTYIKDVQRIYTLEIFAKKTGPTRLESWHTFTDFEKAIEILEACGIFLGLASNLIYTFVHCLQMCNCCSCKVRNIEDRIKRIGKNPICRDEAEIQAVNGKKFPKHSQHKDTTTGVEIKTPATSQEEAEDRTDETTGCGVENQAFQEDPENGHADNVDVYHIKLENTLNINLTGSKINQ